MSYSKLKAHFQSILIIIALISLLLIIYFFISRSGVFPTNFFTGGIKMLLDSITLSHALLVSAFLCLIFCSLYFIILKKYSIRLLNLFILTDLIFYSWLLLPVTGVGQKSVAYVNDLLQQAPKGFPKPSLVYETPQVPVGTEDELRIGNWSWYDKRIVHKRIEYPSALKSTEKLFSIIDSSLLEKPFAYLKNKNGSLLLRDFAPNKITLDVILKQSDTLMILQNAYPGWNVIIDGKENLFASNNYPFLIIPLATADRSVMVVFCPLH
jgi:hypothetical protein